MNSNDLNNIKINNSDLNMIKDVLNHTVPPTCKIYIFGSRFTGKIKKYSDLDLALDFGRKITLAEIADLKEAFENSNLSYMVDIVDINAIDPEFKQQILNNSVRL